nr:MAG TPA: hypothetical protein [Caudoviricetes sp.]
MSPFNLYENISSGFSAVAYNSLKREYLNGYCSVALYLPSAAFHKWLR